jgi:hypothetical protein
MSRAAAIFHQQRAMERTGELLRACRLDRDPAQRSSPEWRSACRMIRNHLAMSRALRVS